MTNKIASEVLKASSIQQMGFCKVIVDGKSFSVKEALDTAIKALEQEPCDDAISRPAVLSYISNDLGFGDEENGKWIDDADKIDAKYGKHAYKCPKCGKYASYFVSGTEVWWDRIEPKFCPNCGAKMVKSQESENKEVSDTNGK